MRFSLSIIILLGLFLNLNASPSDFSKRKQKDKPEEESGISVGMARAWILYNNKDYYGALRIYRELYKKAPSNAKLNYRIGVCFEATNKKDSAIYHLNKALLKDSLINDKAYYYLGTSYQYNDKLDKAIDNYYTYKAKDPENNTDVNRLLRQCETAKYMKNNPVDVKITLLGENINSKYVDASPSITADEQTLIFTSRRKENIGGELSESNEQYYDDIYISKWDKTANEWGKAENIGKPINTSSFDANLSISPNGEQLFIYKNKTGETGSGDIYVSTFNKEGKWSKPKPIDGKPVSSTGFSDYKNINSTFFESSASVTADGNTMYFVSERERGGLGHGDIWVSEKADGVWQQPKNIGPIINTEFDELGVYIHPDGKTLFFSSEGHNSIGGHDIFLTTKNDDGQWSTPVNMGYPINTTKEEIHFVLTTSKQKAYISSTRPKGIGMVDIYEIDMSNYFQSNNNISKDLVKDLISQETAIIRGSIVDSDTGKPLKAEIEITNIKTHEKIVILSEKNGNYFASLVADVKYSITVTSKSFKPYSFKLKLEPSKDGKTQTVTKHILLKK